jgi:urea transport system permease protein
MGLAPREVCRLRLAFPRSLSVAVLLALFLALPGMARAQQDPFADIAATTADIEARGVTALAISGNPRAAAVLDALRDGKLYAWKWPRPDPPLYIRTDKGFIDARTGDP